MEIPHTRIPISDRLKKKTHTHTSVRVFKDMSNIFGANVSWIHPGICINSRTFGWFDLVLLMFGGICKQLSEDLWGKKKNRTTSTNKHLNHIGWH